MENEKKKKLFEEINTELFSSENVLVKNALKNIDKHGDHSLIDPLLRAYMTREEDELKGRMEKMLGALKVSSAEEVLIDALQNEEFASIRQNILSFIWNSGFQPIDHVHTITSVATHGDYMTALEALTVIENIDETISEECLLESTVEIRNYLNENKDDDKRELILSIQKVISNFEVD